MKEYFLEERGIYYRCNTFEEGRPTLLFIHGLSGSSSAWTMYEKKFKNNYNIISYDLRGHGKSKKFNNYSDYDIELFVEDIYELISFIKVKKFFIVSHSFGTLFTIDFVLKYQNLISGVIFLSPNFNVGNKWLGNVMTPFTKSLHALMPDISNKTGRHVDYSKYKNSGDWNIPRMIDDVGNTGLKTYFYCTKQVCGFDRERFLKDLYVPVLVMHGKKDSIFPVSHSLELKNKIKNVHIIILEKSDHILVLNNFEEVSGAIEAFVTEVSSH